MLVFLIGYMAAGKSSVGEELAKAMGYKFLDTDLWIEARSCKSITQIFNEQGEAYFRSKEKECLEFLIDQDKLVIATGGGMPCFNHLMDLMNEMGETVYLNASEETLLKRLQSDSLNRPLLNSAHPSQILSSTLSSHLKKRTLFYTAAKHSFNVDGKTVLKISQEIKKQLERNLPHKNFG
mgnify:CR=1 FL=1|tara:strand:+ start:2213 stop:2752 length:540 start_codon:yes stop_codon:yes gene_type:complete